MDLAELWDDIDGYEGLYEISSHGCVKNVRTGRILQHIQDQNGYHHVGLYRHGIQNKFAVHRLIGEAFLTREEGKDEIDHIDNCPVNNNIMNLRWCTRQENNRNRRKQANTTSTYIGVYWNRQKKKWQSRFTLNGKRKFIGYFNSEEEAALAYDNNIRRHYGEFAKLNF